MNNAERTVTVLHGINNYAKCNKIINLVQADFFYVQLAIDAVNMLSASADFRFDSGILKCNFKLVHGFFEQSHAFFLLRFDKGLKAAAFFGHQIAER